MHCEVLCSESYPSCTPMFTVRCCSRGMRSILFSLRDGFLHSLKRPGPRCARFSNSRALALAEQDAAAASTCGARGSAGPVSWQSWQSWHFCRASHAQAHHAGLQGAGHLLRAAAASGTAGAARGGGAGPCAAAGAGRTRAALAARSAACLGAAASCAHVTKFGLSRDPGFSPLFQLEACACVFCNATNTLRMSC